MSTSTHTFDANVNSLMSIIINSVYSEKDFFMRELISNCSDALDKLALSYTTYENLLPPSEWFIEIKAEGNTLVISDSGIGMTKEDLINFLGCIAESGTKKFKEAKKKNMIGQFGLGFYSSFLVADKVEVISKHPSDMAYKWESDGKNGYTIQQCEYPMNHGTTLVLHMKSGEEEYLTKEKITALVKKFSIFIDYPIYTYQPTSTLNKEKEKNDESLDESHKKEESEDLNPESKTDTDEVKSEFKTDTDEVRTDENDNDEVKSESKTDDTINETDTNEIKTDDTINETDTDKNEMERVRINVDKQVWNKKVEEIPKEELTSFYKHLSNDWDDFLECKSYNLEGVVNFKLLLFIPKRMPFNLFDKSFNKNRIKLYCANVFVTDELNCLPDYLSFVTGIVTTDDLPMSVSRENVQGTSFHKMLKKMVVNKVIDMISGLKEYNDFYKEYSTAMKLMARDDERFYKLLRYNTSKDTDALVSFDDYISRSTRLNQPLNSESLTADGDNGDKNSNKSQSESQSVNQSENKSMSQSSEVNQSIPIYVITGLTKEECLDSFYLKKYSDKEVLLMCEPADELLLQSLKKYNNHPIRRVTTSSSTQSNDDDSFVKEMVSHLNLERILVNNDLVIPCLVTTSEHGTSGTFERIMQAQNANHPYFMFGMGKRTLEVNFNHPLVKRIKCMYEGGDEVYKKVASAMYNTALLSCGYKVNDLGKYCESIYELLSSDHPKTSNEIQTEIKTSDGIKSEIQTEIRTSDGVKSEKTEEVL